jgi:hypothetical protein
MKCLLLVAIIFGLAQQPAKTPTSKGTTQQAAPVPIKTETPTQNKTEAVSHADQKTTNEELKVEELNVQQQLARFTGLLVVVGFLQLLALVGQAFLFLRQARIMGQHRVSLEQLAEAASDNAEAAKKNADAADLNARVLMAAQRPQIAMEAHGNPIQDLLSDDSRVQIEVVNRGAIAAHDCHYESWIELLPFPFKDFTLSADYFKSTEPFSLYLRHQPVIVNIPFTKGLTEEEKNDAKRLLRFVCLRIRLTYKDPFNRDGKAAADFGFYVMRDGLGFLSKYNDSNEQGLG